MLPHGRWQQALIESGLCAGGVAVPRVSASDLEAFERWLSAGYQADMEWMAGTRAVRLDPAGFLPSARSVLVVGLDTWAPPVALQGGGRLARFARGRDYHRFLGRRLRRLQSLLGLDRGRMALDIHPVLERALAAQAGLGWQGKQSQLVSPLFGPWLLLGELFCAEPLEPAPPLPGPSGCGGCRACLKACPTGALRAPGVVDSRRCLSFWTIEARRLAPADIRALQGEWLFGCDLCLEACPVRTAPLPQPDPAFSPPASLAGLTLGHLLRLTPASFELRIRATALRRAGLSGLRRNAAIVAANLGRIDLTRDLAGLLEDPDPHLRAACSWALGRLGTGRSCLEQARAAEPDPEVRREIEDALGRTGP